MVILSNLRGALRRVVPDVPIYAQAAAFAGFITFFPLLLLLLGALASSETMSAAVEEMFSRFRAVLPPGGRTLVVSFLTEQTGNPRMWLSIGAVGTLLGGMQVMTSLMLGFRIIYGDTERPGFLRDQLRALLMITLTIGPWIGAVLLTVFGRQLREWMIASYGLPSMFNTIWGALFTALAFVLAMITLSLIYHFGRPRKTDWNRVWPGTLVATVLWWMVNAGFGLYVRHMPYSVVYGGLAAAIGLLFWMYLSAMVIYIGAGYNAEVFAAPADERTHALSITKELLKSREEQLKTVAGESKTSGAEPE